MTNDAKVIIDGNAVYEIDMDCTKQRNIGKQSLKTQDFNKKNKELLLLLILYFY